MDSLRSVLFRLRALFRRRQLEAEMAEEMRLHLEQRVAEHVAAGLSPTEARFAAQREFGGLTQVQERCRDERQFGWLHDFLRDVGLAARYLRRRPGFTATAVMTLALGMGATTAIFSVVHGVLLKPLPFENPEQLAGLYHRGPGFNLPVMNQGPATYLTYLDHQRAFEEIAAWDARSVSVTGRGEPEQVQALAVSASFLPLLRVTPALGRSFTSEDDLPSTPKRILLSHGYWQRAFGGQADVLGRNLIVDGQPAEILGVLPASFKFLQTEPAFLLPLQVDRAQMNYMMFYFQALGRLRPGLTIADANADLARVLPLLDPIPGYKPIRLEANVRPLAEDVIGNIGRILWILLGVVGLVLLIACANVANLLLVRAEGRQAELAVRAALGASRGRIARELLAESVVLGLAGGVVGLFFAHAALALLRRLAPATLPRVEDIALDPVVVFFAIGLSLLAGLLFGLVPVVKFRTTSTAGLGESSRTASGSRERQRMRNTLTVAEVALSLVLLILSGLMVRTFTAMQRVHPGFTQPEEVQTFRLEVPTPEGQEPAQAFRVHEQIAERLAQVPGVTSVGVSSSITLDGEDNMNTLWVQAVDLPAGQTPPLRRFKMAAPGYFETMGNPLLAGRALTWEDAYQNRRVAVVSENIAREYWREPSLALGQRISGDRSDWYEIVGVVGDERDDGLNRPATSIIYWPLLNAFYPTESLAYAVRSPRVGSPGFLEELQRAIWSINPELPLAQVKTLDEIQAVSTAQTSFVLVMLAIAATVALLLGVVGVYGLISCVATQRTREVGIRMALGAQAQDVQWMFLRHGLVLTGLGIVLGAGVSVAVAEVMSALLFGVSPLDPLTYLVVSAGLMVTTLVATWLPARRAARADPTIALRSV